MVMLLNDKGVTGFGVATPDSLAMLWKIAVVD